MLTPNDAIDALGGTGAVAEALGVPPNTVSTWRERGIPSRRWVEFVRLARKLDCRAITFEALAKSAEARA